MSSLGMITDPNQSKAPSKRPRDGDRLSEAPGGPPPTGPSGRDAIEWVRARRREEREKERTER